MKYSTNKNKPELKNYSIELFNTATGKTATTEVITETLNLEELKKSLPENYQLVTFWIN